MKIFGIQKNESNFQQLPHPFPCIQKGKEKRYQNTLEQGDNASEVSYIWCVRKRKISEKGHHTLSYSSLILRKKYSVASKSSDRLGQESILIKLHILRNYVKYKLYNWKHWKSIWEGEIPSSCYAWNQEKWKRKSPERVTERLEVCMIQL